MAAAHYIEALRLQARAARMHAIFGAKTPHLQTLVVGGVTSIKDLSPERIYKFLDLWRETQDFVEKVTEDVIRAWNENGPARHPFNGETKPQHGDYEQDKGKYSWFKALRYEVEPCEVGPLARALVAYADGNEEFKEVIDGVLQKLDVPVEALFSTLGRTAARGIETLVIGQKIEGWIMDLVENIKNDDTKTYQPWEMPDKGMGYGLNDVARGALGHWIEIEDKKIKNYQYVVPSTWNLGPRCEKGKPGFLLEPRDSSVAVALSA
jgi:[NiFe] hydrogenase large subunit